MSLWKFFDLGSFDFATYIQTMITILKNTQKYCIYFQPVKFVYCICQFEITQLFPQCSQCLCIFDLNSCKALAFLVSIAIFRVWCLKSQSSSIFWGKTWKRDHTGLCETSCCRSLRLHCLASTDGRCGTTGEIFVMCSIFTATAMPTKLIQLLKGYADAQTVRWGQVLEGALHGCWQVHWVAGDWVVAFLFQDLWIYDTIVLLLFC